VDVTASDGAVLKANVIEPTTPGRHPAIVFVNSWGLNDLEYVAQATAFAQAGYTVLSYCARGWWASGGQIDTAGPKDIADTSTVIDWLLANTTADPAHVGMAGVSYGAGISLIASAFDPRIRAVAAMSGWTDLVYSLYGDNTRRQQAALLLQVAAQLLGHPSAELSTNLSSYFANTNIDTVKAFGRGTQRRRRPRHRRTDRPGRPGQPRLGQRAPLVRQLPARHRHRHHRRNPVVLQVRTSGAIESSPAWGAVTGHLTRFGIQNIPWYAATGALGGTPGTGWSHTIWTGTDTTAGGGVALITNGLETLTGEPPANWLPTVSRVNGAVWESTPASSTLALRGIPTLHLALKSAPAQGTLVAYLYVDGTDTGKLIAMTPTTWLSPTTAADVAFPVVAYDVPAGHKLGLVLDTEDPLYLDANGFATALTVAGASWLDVPTK
jgi:X-Pro dipeptidyl-peptidase (S15 family)